jgi:hypothetical protein
MMTSKPRGQATVEAALGTIVLASVLVYAIHFGELGFVELKVQEAAAAALWEATGNGYTPGAGFEHRFPDSDPQPFDQTPSLVSRTTANVQSRYVDLNGLSSVTGAPIASQFYTQVGSLAVNCRMNVPPAFGPGIPFGPRGGSMVAAVYKDNGGITCSAEAVASSSPLMPTQRRSRRYSLSSSEPWNSTD